MTLDPLKLSLVFYPADVLRCKAEPIDPACSHVQAVARRMIELMVALEGAGLAAPQIGLPWRLFVTRDPDNAEHAIAWINPTLEVVDLTVESVEEGCLSLPDILGHVRRPVGIKITGWDGSGQPSEMTSDGFIARVWQHEHDHLDGVLITDKFSAMDRLVNRRAIRNLERSF